MKESDVKMIQAIAAENKKCTVVLIGGSGILCEEWKNAVSSIIMAFYPGMEGGNAVGK